MKSGDNKKNKVDSYIKKIAEFHQRGIATPRDVLKALLNDYLNPPGRNTDPFLLRTARNTAPRFLTNAFRHHRKLAALTLQQIDQGIDLTDLIANIDDDNDVSKSGLKWGGDFEALWIAYFYYYPQTFNAAAVNTHQSALKKCWMTASLVKQHTAVIDLIDFTRQGFFDFLVSTHASYNTYHASYHDTADGADEFYKKMVPLLAILAPDLSIRDFLFFINFFLNYLVSHFTKSLNDRTTMFLNLFIAEVMPKLSVNCRLQLKLLQDNNEEQCRKLLIQSGVNADLIPQMIEHARREIEKLPDDLKDTGMKKFYTLKINNNKTALTTPAFISLIPYLDRQQITDYIKQQIKDLNDRRAISGERLEQLKALNLLIPHIPNKEAIGNLLLNLLRRDENKYLAHAYAACIHTLAPYLEQRFMEDVEEILTRKCLKDYDTCLQAATMIADLKNLLSKEFVNKTLQRIQTEWYQINTKSSDQIINQILRLAPHLPAAFIQEVADAYLTVFDNNEDDLPRYRALGIITRLMPYLSKKYIADISEILIYAMKDLNSYDDFVISGDITRFELLAACPTLEPINRSSLQILQRCALSERYIQETKEQAEKDRYHSHTDLLTLARFFPERVTEFFPTNVLLTDLQSDNPSIIIKKAMEIINEFTPYFSREFLEDAGKLYLHLLNNNPVNSTLVTDIPEILPHLNTKLQMEIIQAVIDQWVVGQDIIHNIILFLEKSGKLLPHYRAMITTILRESLSRQEYLGLYSLSHRIAILQACYTLQNLTEAERLTDAKLHAELNKDIRDKIFSMART